MKLNAALLSALLSSLAFDHIAAAPSALAAAAASAAAEIDFSINPPVPISPVPINILAERGLEAPSQLEQRSAVVNRAAILFPAYIYPASWSSPAAWQPLYTAISSCPHVTFHVIINPNSGPGGATPDSEYQKAITTLREYTNVVLLGYVHTSWGARSSDAVYADISLYSGWRSQGYSMDGIFFDEAPTQATSTLYSYMANITCFAKESITSSLYGNSAMIYFNPGAVPDLRYYTLADFIAVFEDTYTNYLSEASTFAPGTSIPMNKSNFMVHGMSTGWTQSQMTSFVSSLTNGDSLGSVFLTSSTDASNPYGSFAADWTTFVAAVGALNG